MKNILAILALVVASLALTTGTAHAQFSCNGSAADLNDWVLQPVDINGYAVGTPGAGPTARVEAYGTSGADVFHYNMDELTSTYPVDVFGQGGADKICTGGFADYVHGGTGNDYISTGNGADFIVGHDGSDTIRAGQGNDIINSGNGHDDVDGKKGADTITNPAGSDTIHGSGWSDIIWSAGGTVWGDGGTDNCTVSYAMILAGTVHCENVYQI